MLWLCLLFYTVIECPFFFLNKEGKGILRKRGGKMNEEERKNKAEKKLTCVPNCHSVWIQK